MDVDSPLHKQKSDGSIVTGWSVFTLQSILENFARFKTNRVAHKTRQFQQHRDLRLSATSSDTDVQCKWRLLGGAAEDCLWCLVLTFSQRRLGCSL